jgi:hypothetical protein
MAESDKVDLLQICEDLQKASENYESAQQEEGAARSRATSALNHLNEVQKRFDAAIECFRKGAPRNTDWFRKQHDRPFSTSLQPLNT